jgi:hypothetical protein
VASFGLQPNEAYTVLILRLKRSLGLTKDVLGRLSDQAARSPKGEQIDPLFAGKLIGPASGYATRGHFVFLSRQFLC